MPVLGAEAFEISASIVFFHCGQADVVFHFIITFIFLLHTCIYIRNQDTRECLCSFGCSRWTEEDPSPFDICKCQKPKAL